MSWLFRRPWAQPPRSPWIGSLPAGPVAVVATDVPIVAVEGGAESVSSASAGFAGGLAINSQRKLFLFGGDGKPPLVLRGDPDNDIPVTPPPAPTLAVTLIVPPPPEPEPAP